MQWHAQLVLAEAVRRGATLLCADPAAVPFAADQAGAACVSPGRGWRIVSHSGGFRSALQCRAMPDNGHRSDGWVVAAGAVDPDPIRPALWLDPVDAARRSTLQPVSPFMSNLFVDRSLSAEMPPEVLAFVEDLSAGRADPWDWSHAHLVGRPPLRTLSWASPGSVRLELDPLSLCLAPDRRTAQQLVATGQIRLGKDAPVALRVPMLGEPGVSVKLSLNAPGQVKVGQVNVGQVNVRQFNVPPGPPVRVEQQRDANLHQITMTAEQPLDVLDVAVTARAGVVTGAAICLPGPGAEDAGFPDELADYGDPLDAHMPAVEDMS